MKSMQDAWFAQQTVIRRLIEKLEPPVHRQWGEIQRTQVNPEKAALETDKLQKKLHQAIQEDLAKGKYPVYTHEDTLPQDEQYWLISPLSAPLNARYARPETSVNFIFMEGTSPKVAVAWFFAQDRLLMAVEGRGASAPERLRVNNSVILQDSLLLLPQRTSDLTEHNLLAKATEAGIHTRKLGHTTSDIVAVAAGHADVLLATRCTAADVLIAQLVMKEAGGYISDWQGQPITAETTQLVAANSKLHGQALKKLCR